MYVGEVLAAAFFGVSALLHVDYVFKHGGRYRVNHAVHLYITRPYEKRKVVE